MKNAILGLIAIAVLSGCGGSDDKSVGERIDEGIAKVDHAIDKYTDKDDKPQQGDVDPVNTNIDYPLDYGAPLFADPTQAISKISVVTTTKERFGELLNKRTFNFSNADDPAQYIKEIKNDLASLNLNNNLSDAANGLNAFVYLETLSVMGCLYDHGNTLEYTAFIDCSPDDESKVTLTNSGLYYQTTEQGKIIETQEYEVNFVFKLKETTLELPPLLIGLHQGVGIVYVFFPDDVSYYRFGDYRLSDVESSWSFTGPESDNLL